MEKNTIFRGVAERMQLLLVASLLLYLYKTSEKNNNATYSL